MRLVEVTGTSSSCTPMYFATSLATSTSYPSGLPSAPVTPNGPLVGSTAISTLPRLMISSTVCACAGSASAKAASNKNASRFMVEPPWSCCDGLDHPCSGQTVPVLQIRHGTALDEPIRQ